MRMTFVLVTTAFAVLLGAEGAFAQSTVLRSDSVEIDGVRLHYRAGGDGPPLLLLHGFTGAGVWWDPLLDRLTETYTTIVPDLPGHGRSGTGPDPYRFDDVARDVYALMDALNIDRFRAMGYSGGGIVLLHMATQEPDRIEAMAVVSAPHRLIASFHALSEYVEEIDVSPRELAKIEARTLIVLGDRDPVFPAPLALEMYAAIPDAALWIVPAQGHSAVWPDWGGSADAAAIFPAVVARFLGTS